MDFCDIIVNIYPMLCSENMKKKIYGITFKYVVDYIIYLLKPITVVQILRAYMILLEVMQVYLSPFVNDLIIIRRSYSGNLLPMLL